LPMLAGWFDEQFPSIFAEMLAQAIKAVLNRGAVGFRRRPFQPSFAEKLHHKRSDLVFQECRRTPCNDKVSSAGESHPHALAEPYRNVSAHTAPAVEPRRTPICPWANTPGSRRESRASQGVALRTWPRSFLYFR
jgi:hypothetical protein